MTLQGNTLFAGDSMMVGVPPFVRVDGAKTTVAAVGRSASQLLQTLTSGGFLDLPDLKNMVLLIGANDIGGQSGASIFRTVQAIWTLTKEKGVRLIAMTLPPNKGWSNFASNLDAIEQHRRELNEAIRSSLVPDQVIDLDKLMADPGDPQRLAVSYDSGDHLHPRKDATGALLNAALGNTAPSPVPPSGMTLSPPLGPHWGNIVIGLGAIAGIVLLARKD